MVLSKWSMEGIIKNIKNIPIMKKILFFLITTTLIFSCKPKEKEPGTILITDSLSTLPIIDTTIEEPGFASLVEDMGMRKMNKEEKAEKQKKIKISCDFNQKKFNNRKRPKEEAPGGIKGKPPKGPDTQVPTLNGDLTVSNIQATQMNISWPAASDNKSGVTYDLYRNGVKINLSPITTLGFVDIGLTPSTTYTYYYQAKDAAGNYSLMSASITVTTLSGTVDPPTDPPPTGSNNVIYLNFWGSDISNTMWNTSGSLTVGEAGLVQTEIDEIMAQVPRHFPLYNVIVTTNKAVFDAAEEGHKIEIVVTENYEWYGQAGGVAYINSFFWTDKTPAFVFSLLLGYNTHFIAEAIAHEACHTLSLRHQSECVGGVVTVQYRPGWLMGVSYYVDLGITGTGINSLCQTQDDIAKLTVALGPRQMAYIRNRNYSQYKF